MLKFIIEQYANPGVRSHQLNNFENKYILADFSQAGIQNNKKSILLNFIWVIKCIEAE